MCMCMDVHIHIFKRLNILIWNVHYIYKYWNQITFIEKKIKNNKIIELISKILHTPEKLQVHQYWFYNMRYPVIACLPATKNLS